MNENPDWKLSCHPCHSPSCNRLCPFLSLKTDLRCFLSLDSFYFVETTIRLYVRRFSRKRYAYSFFHIDLARCIFTLSVFHFSTFRLRLCSDLLFRLLISVSLLFEALGASSGVQAIILFELNSIGTAGMAQGPWPMA